MFTCDIYIFPKTNGNKNRQWTHLGVLKQWRFICLFDKSEMHQIVMAEHSRLVLLLGSV